MQNPNTTQVGGDHYRSAPYQHWDFVAAFGLNYFVGNATKYLSRHAKKNGRQDLEKALHYVEKMHHLLNSGVVLGGFVSTSDGRVFQVEHRRFCEANGLGHHETMLIYDLCLLDAGPIHLAMLAGRVQQLIEQCYPDTQRVQDPPTDEDDGSLPTPGYINQDR